MEEKSRETRDAPRPSQVNMDVINELELVIDRNNPDDVQEISKILNQILNYPQTSIAETHKEAMRLGNFDLEDKEQKVGKAVKTRLDTSSELFES
jgi:nucleoid DNA-binding protein